jgi:hypothetical protein
VLAGKIPADSPLAAAHLRGVADNVYTKVLQQAAAIEGSTQALAGILRVPEKTLLRWMSGRAQMPLRAFLKAIDLVAKHETENAAKATAASAQQDEKLSFNLGTVFAHCAACAGTQFRRADPAEPLTYLSALNCTSCGAEVNHGRLVVQLAKEVGQHARERLAALKRLQTARRAKEPGKTRV